MNCSTPGSPVLHCLPESAQVHVQKSLGKPRPAPEGLSDLRYDLSCCSAPTPSPFIGIEKMRAHEILGSEHGAGRLPPTLMPHVFIPQKSIH